MEARLYKNMNNICCLLYTSSHKIAPLHVREMFAFTEAQQKHMMQEITEHLEVSECIVFSTCNRTAMYVYSDSESKGCVFNPVSYTHLPAFIKTDIG